MKTANLLKYSLVIGGYFTYLLVLIKISLIAVNQMFLLAGLLPGFLIALNKFLRNPDFRQRVSRSMVPIVGFYFIYFLISTFNAGIFYRGISFSFIFLFHIGILAYLLSQDKFLEIRYTIFGLLLITLFVVFIPHFRVVGSLKLGSFYNLIDPSLLTVTTVEGPLIVALLFLLSVFNAFFHRDYSIINIFSVVLSFFVLLLFSRRGFIFSSILSIAIYYLYVRTNKKLVIYSSLLLLFLPMFWDTISVLVVGLFNFDLFSSFIARNDTEELLTATGRAIAWKNILDLFFSFSPSYFFGFWGGPPEYLFLTTEEGGRYLHAHNSFLQLFLEGGYLICVFFIVILVRAFNLYMKNSNKIFKGHNFYLIIIIFLFSLSATETLIRQVQFSNFIFCYALVGFNMLNTKAG